MKFKHTRCHFKAVVEQNHATRDLYCSIFISKQHHSSLDKVIRVLPLCPVYQPSSYEHLLALHVPLKKLGFVEHVIPRYSSFSWPALQVAHALKIIHVVMGIK